MNSGNNNAKLYSPGIRMWAVLSVLALIVLGSSQIYQAVVKHSSVSATNQEKSLAERPSTPYGSINWQAPDLLTDVDTNPDPDGISNIAGNVTKAIADSYKTLVESGTYTPEEGERVAEKIGEGLRAHVSFKTYGVTELTTATNTSQSRMLAYRNDLRIALEPLLKNPGYELSIFANYVESKDAKYLEQLRYTVENYREAIAATEKVVVPQDAVRYHVGILNTLSQFAETIDRMAAHADDPFASAALLQTYSESEASMVTAFNALAGYYRSKKS